MASAMDALQSFVHLNDSVPSWLSKLDDLTVSVAAHHARFLEMARFGDGLLKRKNLSTESLREGPLHHATIEQDTAAKPTDIYVPPNPSHQCLSHASRARHAANNFVLVRKRKGSNTSLTSEQPRYRTKSLVVVYYDSVVQESFESFFRSIATARSNLRKGKTAATFKARMSSLGIGESSYPAVGETLYLNPKLMRAGLGRRTLGPDFGADDKLSSFDEADKALETSQNLCEVAAHQFLRDGDCRVEMEGMRKKFETCRSIAENEIERLKKEKAREQEGKEAAIVTGQENQLPVTNSVEAKVYPPPPLEEINLRGTGVIEIDDQPDAEPAPIDLSAFKKRTRNTLFSCPPSAT